MHEQQPFLQRHADVVGEFERRAGAAFRAVDDDEVRHDAGLEHRLRDPEEFPRMADALKPVGLPPDSVRSRSTNSSSPRGVENSECVAGEMQSLPIGTPRVSAISGVIFAAGSTPPWPGFAPCDSFTSIILTCGSAACFANLSGLKVPSSLRQPK